MYSFRISKAIGVSLNVGLRPQFVIAENETATEAAVGANAV
jgi:hypothetical protein